MNTKKWFWTTILALFGSLLVLMIFMIWIDPYFHFHGPLPGISYRMNEERYINDGIVNHFKYDAIITGSSTSENFKTTEMNSLFDCNAIKVPFSGGLYKEVSDNLQKALQSDNDVKYVIWGLDNISLIKQADEESYFGRPTYLYDKNIFNDVSYLLNKDIIYRGTVYDIIETVRNTQSTTFDDYGSWDEDTGLDAIRKVYLRPKETIPDRGLSEADRDMVAENIEQNICSVVAKYPNTTFYFFYSPAGIVRWDLWNREGNLSAQIEAEEIATKLLLSYDNVKLFCFYENTDMITNLEYYKDTIHYVSDVNNMILEWMWEGKYQLTAENAEEHTNYEKKFYMDYDYDAIFE